MVERESVGAWTSPCGPEPAGLHEDARSATAAPGTDWRLAAAMLASIAIFGFALGATYPLLSLALNARGIGDFLVGFNSAMAGAGLVASCCALPLLLRRCGALALMIGGLVASAVTLLLFAATDDLVAWFALRLLLGFSLNAVFVLGEAWLNAVASDAGRGRMMGLCTTANAAGFAAGPTLLLATGLEGWLPYATCAAMIAAGVMPLVLVRRRAARYPLPPAHLRMIFAFFLGAPLLAVVVGAYAVFDAAALALLPVYSVEVGWTPEQGALAVSVFLFGMVFSQVPVGWLIDRFGRSSVLIACCGVAASGLVVLPVSYGLAWLPWAVLFVVGGASYALYTASLAVLGARYRDGRLVAGSAGFALLYGVGAVLGPFAYGGLMEHAAPQAFPYAASAMFVVLALACIVFGLRRGMSAASQRPRAE